MRDMDLKLLNELATIFPDPEESVTNSENRTLQTEEIPATKKRRVSK